MIFSFLLFHFVFASLQIDPVSKYFKDEFGRVRIFHGINVVYKKFPWYPPFDGPFNYNDSLNTDDIGRLKQYGFNMVRLGVMWPGTETAPGVYNTTYLDQISQIIRMLAKDNIYTLVDVHQDLGSRYFCGEGFPEFYVADLLNDPNSKLAKAEPFAHPFADTLNLTNGFPDIHDCLSRQFATYYTSDRAGKLFQNLYTKGSALNMAFGNMWEFVAKYFAKSDVRDSIIGYELINEPWYGDTVGNPLLYVEQGHTDRYFLQPMYQSVAKRIRAVDATIPIFFEPATPDFHVGFSELPLPQSDPNQVFSFHVYCTQGTSIFQKGICSIADGLFENIFGSFMDKMNITGFMTEFGAVPNNTQNLKQITYQMDWVEKQFKNWAYWQYKYFEDITTANPLESLWSPEGNLETNKVETLSRTYAYAISGQPVSTNFDSESKAFDLTYISMEGENHPTEIYFNAEQYPSGVVAEATPANCVELSQLTNQVMVHSTCSGGTSVKVSISRK